MSDSAMRKGALRGLTSIGALAAASGGLTDVYVEADLIVTDVNQDIGFAPGDATSYFLSDLPGGNAGTAISTSQFFGPGTHSLGIFGGSAHYFRLRTTTSSGVAFAKRLDAGVKWGSAGGGIHPYGLVSLRTSHGSGPNLDTFTDKYFAFEFKDASQGDALRYGWIEGSLSDNSYSNMTFHLTAYAYDDSGVQIAMGDRGAVPEPGTSALMLLGAALIGGAEGVRRWKQAKHAGQKGL